MPGLLLHLYNMFTRNEPKTGLREREGERGGRERDARCCKQITIDLVAKSVGDQSLTSLKPKERRKNCNNKEGGKNNTKNNSFLLHFFCGRNCGGGHE